MQLTELVEDEKNKTRKRRIDYKDTAKTYKMRQTLEKYNNFIKDFTFEVRVEKDDSDSVKIKFSNLKGLEEANRLGTIAINTINNICRNDRHIAASSSSLTKAYLRSLAPRFKYSVKNLADQYSGTSNNNYMEDRYRLDNKDISKYITEYIDDNSKSNYIIYPLLRQNQSFSRDVSSLYSNSASGPSASQLDSLHHDITLTPQEILSSIITRNRLLEVPVCRIASLSEWGVWCLRYTIDTVRLYRSFSRGRFTLGGRFYSNYHERMPKTLRQYLYINGQPTVELDYSAHHVRISYHLEGIDYSDDPYLAACDNPEERELFKQLQLIFINAESEPKAIYAFQEKAFREGFEESLLNHRGIKKLVRRFKKAHKPIIDYMHSDAGVRLQYIDSNITEAILKRLMKEGVPCLPVHDSYIVPSHNEDLLRHIMITEYEKKLGFKPVIG